MGLGKLANVRELISASSEPKAEHVFTAFLDTLPDNIVQGIYKGKCVAVTTRYDLAGHDVDLFHNHKGDCHDRLKLAFLEIPNKLIQGKPAIIAVVCCLIE